MKRAIAIVAGLILTALLLWLVMGGTNAWRRAAFPERPDAGVRIQFFTKPR